MDGNATTRSPWGAMALSLVATGLGHIYCGRLAIGVVLYCVWLPAAALVILASLMPVSRASFFCLILAPTLAVCMAWVGAAIDAFRTARRIGNDFTPQNYNRSIVYVALAILGLAYPCVLMAGIRQNAFEAFLIPTNSMRPNVVSGDRILVNKRAYHRSEPQRGDLVVFRAPGPTAQSFIKRIVALPGDTIDLQKGEVIVNGKRLARVPLGADEVADLGVTVDGYVYYEENTGSRYPVLVDPEDPRGTLPKPIHVGDDEVFMLGDHRANSRDSRQFGAVKLSEIQGEVAFIYWSGEASSRFGPMPE